MRLFHYVNGKLQAKYDVEPGTSLETVFKEVATWPGTKLILVKN